MGCGQGCRKTVTVSLAADTALGSHQRAVSRMTKQTAQTYRGWVGWGGADVQQQATAKMLAFGETTKRSICDSAIYICVCARACVGENVAKFI